MGLGGRIGRDERGFGTAAGLIVVGLSLALVAVLTLLATGTFSSSSSGGTPDTESLFSSSSTETNLQLCVDGRPSPLTSNQVPTPGQQATCTRELAGQIGGGGGTLPVTLPSSPNTSIDVNP